MDKNSFRYVKNVFFLNKKINYLKQVKLDTLILFSTRTDEE